MANATTQPISSLKGSNEAETHIREIFRRTYVVGRESIARKSKREKEREKYVARECGSVASVKMLPLPEHKSISTSFREESVIREELLNLVLSFMPRDHALGL